MEQKRINSANNMEFSKFDCSIIQNIYASTVKGMGLKNLTISSTICLKSHKESYLLSIKYYN